MDCDNFPTPVATVDSGGCEHPNRTLRHERRAVRDRTTGSMEALRIHDGFSLFGRFTPGTRRGLCRTRQAPTCGEELDPRRKWRISGSRSRPGATVGATGVKPAPPVFGESQSNTGVASGSA